MLKCGQCRLTATHLRLMTVTEHGDSYQTWNSLRPFPKLLNPEERVREDAGGQRKEKNIISFLR